MEDANLEEAEDTIEEMAEFDKNLTKLVGLRDEFGVGHEELHGRLKILIKKRVDGLVTLMERYSIEITTDPIKEVILKEITITVLHFFQIPYLLSLSKINLFYKYST